jgi:hypothetical protein
MSESRCSDISDTAHRRLDEGLPCTIRRDVLWACGADTLCNGDTVRGCPQATDQLVLFSVFSCAILIQRKPHTSDVVTDVRQESSGYERTPMIRQVNNACRSVSLGR